MIAIEEKNAGIPTSDVGTGSRMPTGFDEESGHFSSRLRTRSKSSVVGIYDRKVILSIIVVYPPNSDYGTWEDQAGSDYYHLFWSYHSGNCKKICQKMVSWKRNLRTNRVLSFEPGQFFYGHQSGLWYGHDTPCSQFVPIIRQRIGKINRFHSRANIRKIYCQ